MDPDPIGTSGCFVVGVRGGDGGSVAELVGLWIEMTWKHTELKKAPFCRGNGARFPLAKAGFQTLYHGFSVFGGKR